MAAVLSGEDALVATVPPRMNGGQLRARRDMGRAMVASGSSRNVGEGRPEWWLRLRETTIERD